MRQAYDYWQDQPGSYPSKRGTRLGTPLVSASLQKGGWHSFLNLLTDWESTRPRKTRARRVPPRPREKPLLSLPRLSTASPLQASGLPVGLTSPRKAEKLPRGRITLANLCLYSWPKAIRYNIHPDSRCPPQTTFAYKVTRFMSCHRQSKFFSTLLFFPPNTLISYPRTHSEQGLLIRTESTTLSLSVFPEACPYISTRNRLFTHASNYT